MSIPSSSELVATRHGSSPAFSSSSTFVRSSRASEPWWARAISTARRRAVPRPAPSSLRAASSFSRSATRSAERRLLTNTIVELCARTSSQQLGVDRRPDRPRAWTRRPATRLERIALGLARRDGGGAGSAIDSTGTSMRRSSGLARARVDDRHLAVRARRGSGRSPRAGSGSRSGRSAGRAAGRAGARLRRSRRSSVSARCEPRLEWATAWISSTITASTPLSISRAREVSIRYSDSGVVIRMSGGLRSHRRALALGRVAGADADAHVLGADPAQRRAQVALDVVGERLQRADVDHARAAPRAGAPPSGSAAQPVERPQERRERLARAGRRREQHVLAAARSPATPAPGPASARRRPLEPRGPAG